MDAVGGGPLRCRGFDPAYAGCGMSARQMRWTNLRQTRCAPSPHHKRVYARLRRALAQRSGERVGVRNETVRGALSPLPAPELGLARVRHLKWLKSGRPDFSWGEGTSGHCPRRHVTQ